MIERPPLIVQLCPRLNSGGIERGTVDLAIALQKVGFRSIVISGGGYLEQELAANKVEHIKLPIYSKNPFVFIINLIRLDRLLSKLNPQLIHPRSRIPSWLIYFLRNKLSGHFLTSCNGIHSIDKLGLKKIYNGVLIKGEKVSVNSEFTKNYLVGNYGIDPVKITVIYRGVDTHRFDPSRIDKAQIEQLAKKWGIDNKSFKILLPSRLSYWKGQHIFIEACHKLKTQANLNFVALLVGDCRNQSYLNSLKQLIKQYSLEQQIKIIGEVAEMPLIYALSDLVISSSIEPEAFGRTMVEAQFMNKPVIATSHGGATEIIIPNVSGWLYPPEDAQALAEQITEVALLPEDERQKVLSQALQRAKTYFTEESMCQAYIKLYSSML